jgi:arylsulfatase A-like enzyme
VPDGLDGKSLAPVIRAEREGVRDTIFLAYRDVQRAVRHGRWKLIRYPRVDATQLFDLEADPHETKDLAAAPGQAGRIRELMERLRRQQELFSDTCALAVDQPRPAGVTLELLEKLAAAAPQPRKPAKKP